MKRYISIIFILTLMVMLLCNVSAEESGHIFYWSFDGHSTDLSHNILDFEGDVSYTEGVVGKAVDLRDESTLLTDTVPIEFSKFTVSLWVKIFENENGYGIMLAKGSKTAGHFELYLAKSGGDGNLEDFEIRVWSPDFNDFQTGKYVEYEKWVHIATTYDGSVCKIYLDGEKIYESGATGGLNPVTDTNSNILAIGSLVDETLPLNGLVDEVVLADYVLPESDIVKLAKSPKDAIEDIKGKVIANYPEGTTPRPDPTAKPSPTATVTPEPTATVSPTVKVTPTATGGSSQSSSGISTPVKIGVIVFLTLVVAGCIVFFVFRKKN